MPENNVHLVFRLVRLAAQVMLESGGEIYRVEETVQRMCEALQYPAADVLAIPAGIFITLELPDQQLTQWIYRPKPAAGKDHANAC